MPDLDDHSPSAPDRLHIAINAWRDTSHELAGGSEIMIDQVASGLARRGHRVELRAGGPVTDHDYLVRDGGGKFSQYLRAPADHLRHQRQADLVVDVANGMAFYSPLWRRRPTLCFVHHVHTEQWSQWFPAPVAALGRTLERRAMPAAYSSTLFVTVSPSSAKALVELGVAEDRIRIVPNGVELPAEPGAKTAEPSFVAVGRLVPHKRYDLLVEMWREVQAQVGGTLSIIGEGPEADRLAAMDVPGLSLLGRVDEATRDRLYAESWLLLHPSMLEGWGLVVMEAAGHGTPTLAFDAPGVRDSIVDSRTGLLARDRAEYIDMWIDLARSHDLRAKLGAGARDRAKEFSWDATVERFEAVAREAVELGRLPRARPRRPSAATGSSAGSASDATVRQGGGGAAPDEPLPTTWEMLKLFRHEKTDPDPFYAALARRSITQLAHPVAGQRILDLGCGHGYDTLALREAGAEVFPVDMNPAKLIATGELLEGSIQGDATRLPFPDRTFDGIWCSNLLEHTPSTPPVFDEIERVLKPGGWAWVSWTNWYSPWGGHEIVPLHMLGPNLGLKAWRRLVGEPRINVPFVELWPTYIGKILADVRSRPGLRLTDATPRYWSNQRWILKVPGLREVATWNCVLELERTSP